MSTNNTENSIPFGLSEDNKHLYMVLSQLYSKPWESVIREISTNCKDAHNMSNKQSLPFVIKLPNPKDNINYIIFRDYGPGLTREEVIDIYSVYGESTKRQASGSKGSKLSVFDNKAEVTGSLGLGSKSPFAVCNSFQVKSYVDGKVYMFTCFLNDKEEPSITMSPNIVETSEENGLEIIIPVYDELPFENYIANELRFFDIKPIVYKNAIFNDDMINLDIFKDVINNSYCTHKHKLSQTIYCSNDLKQIIKELFFNRFEKPEIYSDYSFFNKKIPKLWKDDPLQKNMVEQLSVHYPLDKDIILKNIDRYNTMKINVDGSINKKYRISNDIINIIKYLLDVGIIIKATGQVAFVPSRENIKYTDSTIEYLISNLIKVSKNILKIISNKYGLFNILSYDDWYNKIFMDTNYIDFLNRFDTPKNLKETYVEYEHRLKNVPLIYNNGLGFEGNINQSDFSNKTSVLIDQNKVFDYIFKFKKNYIIDTFGKRSNFFSAANFKSRYNPSQAIFYAHDVLPEFNQILMYECEKIILDTINELFQIIMFSSQTFINETLPYDEKLITYLFKSRSEIVEILNTDYYKKCIHILITLFSTKFDSKKLNIINLIYNNRYAINENIEILINNPDKLSKSDKQSIEEICETYGVDTEFLINIKKTYMNKENEEILNFIQLISRLSQINFDIINMEDLVLHKDLIKEVILYISQNIQTLDIKKLMIEFYNYEINNNLRNKMFLDFYHAIDDTHLRSKPVCHYTFQIIRYVSSIYYSMSNEDKLNNIKNHQDLLDLVSKKYRVFNEFYILMYNFIDKKIKDPKMLSKYSSTILDIEFLINGLEKEKDQDKQVYDSKALVYNSYGLKGANSNKPYNSIKAYAMFFANRLFKDNILINEYFFKEQIKLVNSNVPKTKFIELLEQWKKPKGLHELYIEEVVSEKSIKKPSIVNKTFNDTMTKFINFPYLNFNLNKDEKLETFEYLKNVYNLYHEYLDLMFPLLCLDEGSATNFLANIDEKKEIGEFNQHDFEYLYTQINNFILLNIQPIFNKLLYSLRYINYDFDNEVEHFKIPKQTDLSMYKYTSMQEQCTDLDEINEWNIFIKKMYLLKKMVGKIDFENFILVLVDNQSDLDKLTIIAENILRIFTKFNNVVNRSEGNIISSKFEVINQLVFEENDKYKKQQSLEYSPSFFDEKLKFALNNNLIYLKEASLKNITNEYLNNSQQQLFSPFFKNKIKNIISKKYSDVTKDKINNFITNTLMKQSDDLYFKSLIKKDVEFTLENIKLDLNYLVKNGIIENSVIIATTHSSFKNLSYKYKKIIREKANIHILLNIMCSTHRAISSYKYELIEPSNRTTFNFIINPKINFLSTEFIFFGCLNNSRDYQLDYRLRENVIQLIKLTNIFIVANVDEKTVLNLIFRVQYDEVWSLMNRRNYLQLLNIVKLLKKKAKEDLKVFFENYPIIVDTTIMFNGLKNEQIILTFLNMLYNIFTYESKQLLGNSSKNIQPLLHRLFDQLVSKYECIGNEIKQNSEGNENGLVINFEEYDLLSGNLHIPNLLNHLTNNLSLVKKNNYGDEISGHSKLEKYNMKLSIYFDDINIKKEVIALNKLKSDSFNRLISNNHFDKFNLSNLFKQHKINVFFDTTSKHYFKEKNDDIANNLWHASKCVNGYLKSKDKHIQFRKLLSRFKMFNGIKGQKWNKTLIK